MHVLGPLILKLYLVLVNDGACLLYFTLSLLFLFLKILFALFELIFFKDLLIAQLTDIGI